MPDTSSESRRRFLTAASAAGAAVILSACQTASKHDGDDKESDEGEKVTPGEDLMQEHGVLKRILLIYGEGIRRIDASEDLAPEAIDKSARLIRSFVEEYHEKQEEDWVFPRLQKANKETDTAIARRVNKTPAQVLLAWAIQRGTALLTTSKTPSRIRENFDVSAIPQDAIREINEGITSQVRFNAVTETGIPGFIPREKK